MKTTQNVTNINISSQPQPQTGSPNNSSNDLQIFQKGPQVTALVANLPGLDVSKESHTSLPVRSKSSLSNVSNTHIPAPSPQPSDNYACHKSHRHKHRSPRTKSSHEELSESKPTYRNHHHGHDKEYYSETSGNEYIKEHHRRSVDYNSKNSLMDQSYKKASMIVHDLTKSKENGYDSVYEKHRQKCITASEKYNNHLLRHYNSRKSASVLDFRSQVNSRYSESRSSERLDSVENEKNSGKFLQHRRIDSRSVKSLDFDNDCNPPRSTEKIIDYTSEPIDSMEKPHYYHHPPYLDNIKPRPTPPKKPLRLSLHKTQSLQSVETPVTTPNGSPDKNDSRKPLKRNHKGETQYIPLLNVKIEGSPERHRSSKDYIHKSAVNGLTALKWSNFSPSKLIENGK